MLNPTKVALAKIGTMAQFHDNGIRKRLCSKTWALSIVLHCALLFISISDCFGISRFPFSHIYGRFIAEQLRQKILIKVEILFEFIASHRCSVVICGMRLGVGASSFHDWFSPKKTKWKLNTPIAFKIFLTSSHQAREINFQWKLQDTIKYYATANVRQHYCCL